MPLGVAKSHSGPGVWVERSDHRDDGPPRDPSSPEFRRNKYLSMLLCYENGISTFEMAIWFRCTERRVQMILKRAREFRDQMRPLMEMRDAG